MKLNYFLILIICVLLLCFNIYIFKRNSTSDRMQDTIIRLVNEDSVKRVVIELSGKLETMS